MHLPGLFQVSCHLSLVDEGTLFGLIHTRISAFNAIISAAVVSLDLSYAMPILVNCLQGRRALPERKWKIPNTIGWVIDMVCPLFSRG